MLVQTRNEADALIYSVQKTLNEQSAMLDPGSRSHAESAINELKEAMKGEDAARIRQLTENLQQIAHTMAQAAYSQNASAGAGTAGHAQGAERYADAQDDDVVDAEYENVA